MGADEPAYIEVNGSAAPLISDAFIADRFAQTYANELRYVDAWGRWMRFDGTVWREENTLMAFDCARKECRGLAHMANKPGDQKAILSAKTIAAVERIAKADRRLAGTVEQWDVDPFLLNTPDGTVDLRTGKLRAHDPLDYITKITAVGPKGDCPQWKAHLLTIMGGDEELVAYLQRSFGYSLTGTTKEHAMFFGHGGGANGKGTTIETVSAIFGSYARTAPMQAFTSSNTNEHPTELAMLRGARLVTASETEEGRRWAESRIKQMTGGDKIAARFMRQDFFEYVPQFKLWITGNHKPGLRSVGEAIRRRMNLIPFLMTFPADKRDLDLPTKLKAEWAGILAWMIKGTLTWQRDGLKQPKAVREATDEYLLEEDALKQWFDDNYKRDPKSPGLFTSELYDNWKPWAERAGEYPISRKKFSMMLEDRAKEFGIEKVADLQRDGKHGRGFAGLTLTF